MFLLCFLCHYNYNMYSAKLLGAILDSMNGSGIARLTKLELKQPWGFQFHMSYLHHSTYWCFLITSYKGDRWIAMQGMFIWKTSLSGVRQDWLRLNWESEGSQQWTLVMSLSLLSLKNSLTTAANIEVCTWSCLHAGRHLPHPSQEQLGQKTVIGMIQRRIY